MVTDGSTMPPPISQRFWIRRASSSEYSRGLRHMAYIHIALTTTNTNVKKPHMAHHSRAMSRATGPAGARIDWSPLHAEISGTADASAVNLSRAETPRLFL